MDRYPNARAINRKIIFHAGPTNSGKTYQALERFINAKSGVYCGPLKLLATEVYKKTNDRVRRQFIICIFAVFSCLRLSVVRVQNCYI